MALVYRGKASTPGCPEAAAALLVRADRELVVRFVGPRESTPVTSAVLAGAHLYVQPGGPSLRRAYRRLRRQHEAIAHFVRTGGRYLGLCLGGYLAGATPGFSLLPGDAQRYIDTPGAGISGAGDAVVPVTWAGARRQVFFQDGPCFEVDAGSGAQVLARYPNGRIAALVCRHGDGVVGVVGPHPEADAQWFLDAGLPIPSCLALDLGVDLVRRVLST